MAKCLNLEMFQKTSKKYLLRFKNKATGVATDITDYKVYFTVKERVSDLDPAAKINHDVFTHSDPLNGKTIIDITKADSDLDPGSYVYSIDYDDGNDGIGVLFWGRLKINKKTAQRV